MVLVKVFLEESLPQLRSSVRVEALIAGRESSSGSTGNIYHPRGRSVLMVEAKSRL